MTSSLIQPLLDGPLDIVGDVHGEIEPLHSLMRHLGYDDDDSHPDGRRLVLAARGGELDPDVKLSPEDQALVTVLAPQVKLVFENHGGKVGRED